MKVSSIALHLFVTLCLLASWIVIIPSGVNRCFAGGCGDVYYGAHEHDAIWHLAVAEMMLNNSKWQMPTFAGESLAGYNYGIDLVIAGLSKLTQISTKDWYFRALPLIWGLGMVKLLFVFAKKYRPSESYIWFLLLFSFFGSSLSYLLTLFHKGTIWGSSGILSMQALQVMTNPQLGLSLLAIIGYFILLLSRKELSYRDYLMMGLLAASALALKFYAGIILLLIIGLDAGSTLIKKQSRLRQVILGNLVVLIPVLTVLVLLYQPSGTTFPFKWDPFATVVPIIEEARLFYLPSWAQRLYDLSGIKLLSLQLVITLIFIIMNYGARLLAVLVFVPNQKDQSSRVRNMILFGAVAGLLLNILLTQVGVWWNTTQFLHISLFLSGILAAEALDKLYQKISRSSFLQIMLVVTVVMIILPGNMDTIKTFAFDKGGSYVASEEMRALAALKNLPPGVVFVPLFETGLQTRESAVLPLSKKLDSAYVAAYSGQVVYYANQVQLELLNIPYQSRKIKVEDFSCEILEEVDYLWVEKSKPYLNRFDDCHKTLYLSYSDQYFEIYQTRE